MVITTITNRRNSTVSIGTLFSAYFLWYFFLGTKTLHRGHQLLFALLRKFTGDCSVVSVQYHTHSPTSCHISTSAWSPMLWSIGRDTFCTRFNYDYVCCASLVLYSSDWLGFTFARLYPGRLYDNAKNITTWS